MSVKSRSKRENIIVQSRLKFLRQNNRLLKVRFKALTVWAWTALRVRLLIREGVDETEETEEMEEGVDEMELSVLSVLSDNPESVLEVEKLSEITSM